MKKVLSNILWLGGICVLSLLFSPIVHAQNTGNSDITLINDMQNTTSLHVDVSVSSTEYIYNFMSEISPSSTQGNIIIHINYTTSTVASTSTPTLSSYQNDFSISENLLIRDGNTTNIAHIQLPTELQYLNNSFDFILNQTIQTQNVIIRYNDQIVFNDSFVLATSTHFYYTQATSTLETTSTEKNILNTILQAVEQNAHLSINANNIIYYPSMNSYYLKCITINNEEICDNWQYVVNGQYSNLSIDQFTIDDTQQNTMYLYFGQRYKISTDKQSYENTETITATLFEYDYQNGSYVTSTDTNKILATVTSTGWIDTVIDSHTINNNGQTTLISPHNVGTYSLGLENDGAWGKFYYPKTSFDITEHIPLTITIYYQNDLIYQNNITYPTSSTYSYHDPDTNTDITTSTDKITVLGILSDIDKTTDTFQLSETVKSSYGIYLKCIDIKMTSSTQNACDNWHYVVDGQYPWISIADYELDTTKDHSIYLYFGDQTKISTHKNSYQTNETILADIYEYDYKTGQYVSSTKQTSQLDLYTQSSSTTHILASSTIGIDAHVEFTAPTTTGTYYIGINGGGWYWPSISITVTSTQNQDNPEDNSGSGSSGTNPVSTHIISQQKIDETVHKLLSYLKSQQDETGKILDGNMTDWAIMSFGANEQYAKDIKHTNGTSLLDYEKSYSLDASSDMSACASYPRHIMALLSAGISKNDDAIKDLQNKIHVDCYTDNQFGTTNTYGQIGTNDDIFALIALLSIETDYNQDIIQYLVQTIKQTQDDTTGGFNMGWGASPDATGASINALKNAQNRGIAIDNQIFTKAKTYLKNNQFEDGSWGYLDWQTQDPTPSILTTSWVLMGLNALGETQQDWMNNKGYTPYNLLISKVNEDGYYTTADWQTGELVTDWFSLKHAVPALLETSWPIILDPIVEDFSQNATYSYGGGGTSIPQKTHITTTTDDITTTTTLDIVTSTIDIVTTTEKITSSTQKTNTTVPQNNTTIVPQKPSHTAQPVQKVLGAKIKKTILSHDTNNLIPEKQTSENESLVETNEDVRTGRDLSLPETGDTDKKINDEKPTKKIIIDMKNIRTIVMTSIITVLSYITLKFFKILL